MGTRPQRALLVASAGGHWVQLRRVVPAFEGAELVYISTSAACREQVGSARFYPVRDANHHQPFGCIHLAIQLFFIMLAERPDVVFSTGAAPGCIGILIGRLVGARTIWLDSIANVERLSLSGRLIRRVAGLVLTQWPELADDRVEYAGAVL